MEGHAMTLRPLLAAVALAASFAMPALAFDLPPPVDAPEITTFTTASGWYIRGDLGYNAAFDVDKPSIRTFKSSRNEYSTTTFDSARISSDYSLNAGAGYQFNDWLRSDLTVDYFRGKFHGKSQTDTRCSGIQPGGTKCASSYEQSLASLGLMANGYVDLGTYWGVTPYLGAGAGLTNVDWGNLSASKYCVNGSGTCDKFAKYKNTTSEGLESWRFTYALMAGISYDISTNLKLDLGYRLSQVAGGDMVDWGAKDRKHGATGTQGEDNGFMRQEFRAGLRMTSW
jgi:opacity protein-like surface antigen